MDQSNISMKTWIFSLSSLELVHPLLLQALVPIRKKGSNYSDSNSDIAEPPSKKACKELIQPLIMKRKYSKKWENEFSWLVYDEDINGAFCRVCKHPTIENSTQEVFGSQNRSRIGRKLPRQ